LETIVDSVHFSSVGIAGLSNCCNHIASVTTWELGSAGIRRQRFGQIVGARKPERRARWVRTPTFGQKSQNAPRAVAAAMIDVTTPELT
jgi:hypothetical protein